MAVNLTCYRIVICFIKDSIVVQIILKQLPIAARCNISAGGKLIPCVDFLLEYNDLANSIRKFNEEDLPLDYIEWRKARCF